MLVTGHRSTKSLGHQARPIAPQYIRPFVNRQKNDAADAEAIAIAFRQPEMRFVSSRSENQQARAAVFRGRERLSQEYGNTLPKIMVDKCADILAFIGELSCNDLLNSCSCYSGDNEP